MGRGFFIVLEGVDGSGKTTQARLLAEALRLRGFKVVLTQEPSEGPTGRKIREYLGGLTRHLRPEEELALFMADRREHVAGVIEPALSQNKVVISDRYYYSSAAYQGALGLDPEQILAAHQEFAPRPHLVIFLNLPLAQAEARRRGQARQVSEGLAYLEEVAGIYDTFQGPHLHRVDATGPVEETHAQVLEVALKAIQEQHRSTDGERRMS
jgi:dTMP kinase